jgi:ABC-2 type transport system ATP-binding protein
MPQVVVQNLRKQYGPVTAVDSVTFDIQAGEIFGLIGPNGAGKTTTVECLIGLRHPDGGSIEICGIDARRRPQDVKQRIGASLQTSALQDKITAREALALFGGFYARRATPQHLLERFNLLDKADAAFDTLSAGQRQRLGLALAFVNEPELVFLDEPTTGLDPQARRELHGDIARMKDDGRTVLLTTHYLDEAQQLCDRIAIINHGRVIAAGAPHELMARSSAIQSIAIVTASAIAHAALAGLPDIQALEGEGVSWRFQSGNVNRTLGALVGMLGSMGIEITELHVQKASLEDVFLELTAAK